MKHLNGAPIGLALALPSNSKTWLERVSKDKCSNLLGLVISNEGKKFYNIDICFPKDSNELNRLDKNECYVAGWGKDASGKKLLSIIEKNHNG